MGGPYSGGGAIAAAAAVAGAGAEGGGGMGIDGDGAVGGAGTRWLEAEDGGIVVGKGFRMRYMTYSKNLLVGMVPHAFVFFFVFCSRWLFLAWFDLIDVFFIHGPSRRPFGRGATRSRSRRPDRASIESLCFAPWDPHRPSSRPRRPPQAGAGPTLSPLVAVLQICMPCTPQLHNTPCPKA
jgi:hypothetical protein